MMEGTLDVYIAKELNLGPLDGSIITAPLQFKAKSVLLQSLLYRNESKNKAALATLKALQNMGDRNDLVHGLVQTRDDGLSFLRRRNDGFFKSEEKPYSLERLALLSLEMAQHVAALRHHAGVTEREVSDFFDDAHNAQIRPSKSPSPPSSKRSRLSKSQPKRTPRQA